MSIFHQYHQIELDSDMDNIDHWEWYCSCGERGESFSKVSAQDQIDNHENDFWAYLNQIT